MTRLEFTRKTRRDAKARSGDLCEAVGIRFGLAPDKRCNAPLSRGCEFHHNKEAEYGGDNSLENCLCICLTCHKFVTKQFIRELRKADRIRDKRSGAMKPRSTWWKPDDMIYDWSRKRYVSDDG